MTRMLGIGLNLVLRGLLLASMVAVLTAPPGDPRFADKGIGPRTVVVVGGLSLLIPALWLWRGRHRPYPAAMDALYLSIFALDLGGNVLNLYNSFRFFDLIPHTHGTGALTVVAAWLLRLPILGATAVAQVLHVLLEAQEYYSDVLFGTRNVRGTWDVINDLLVGIAGSIAYGGLYQKLWRERGKVPSWSPRD